VFRKKRFLIAGGILLVALGLLGYRSFMEANTYYSEVSEVLEQDNSLQGENLRVRGEVVPGSVEQETDSLLIRFDLADVSTEDQLAVVYRGVVPDSFKAGNEVVIEGHLNSETIFEASAIVGKCASRYVSAN
jgi:cytochrome c-type biogenesis protein CcmE